MEQILITLHEFEKQNNITIIRGKKAYDKYKCKTCGLEAVRYGLTNTVNVSRNKVCCSYYKRQLDLLKKAKKVKVVDEYPCRSFGFVLGEIYNTIECPESFKDKYSDDIWIFSNERREPVRLLPNEYLIVNE